MSELSSALKRFRKEFNLTQKQAAEIAGIAERVYQSYEYGKVIPTATVLSAIANRYKVSMDYLVGRSNCPDYLVYDENGIPIIIEAMRPNKK